MGHPCIDFGVAWFLLPLTTIQQSGSTMGVPVHRPSVEGPEIFQPMREEVGSEVGVRSIEERIWPCFITSLGFGVPVLLHFSTGPATDSAGSVPQGLLHWTSQAGSSGWPGATFVASDRPVRSDALRS